MKKTFVDNSFAKEYLKLYVEQKALLLVFRCNIQK